MKAELLDSGNVRRVQVDCGDDKVNIDFFDETAQRTDSNGEEMIYMGGLSEANDARGWITLG